MTNKEIRVKSRGLYRQNILRYLLASILMLIPGGVSVVINEAARRAGMPEAGSIILFIVTVAAYPLSLGAAGFFYYEFQGVKCQVKSVARFYTDKKALKHALILGGIISGINYVLSNITSWLQLLTGENSLAQGLLGLLMLPIAILQIILYCRLFLTSFIYINIPEQKPLDTIKESLQKMKGNVFALIGFGFSTFWVAFLPAMIAVIIIMVGMIGSGSTSMTPKMLAVVYLLIIPFGPYIQLCMAGFAEKLLSGRKKPEPEEENRTYTPPKFQV